MTKNSLTNTPLAINDAATETVAIDPVGTVAVVKESLASADNEAVLAQTALSASPIVELRDLVVRRVGTKLTIEGTVNCFYHKQLAQETVRPFASDLRMVNEVHVIQRRPR